MLDPLMEPKQQLTLKIREDLRVIVMKEYSTLLRFPEQESYHQMLFSVILKIESFSLLTNYIAAIIWKFI